MRSVTTRPNTKGGTIIIGVRDASREVVQLAVFDNRIEVTSPGGLPGTVTVNNLINRQHSRNPLIAKRMFEMGFLEAWGLGIDTIISWGKKTGKKPPLFKDDEGQFTCVIYATPEIPSANMPWDGLSDKEEKLLGLFAEHTRLTNRQLRELCALSKTQVHTVITRLIKKKLVVRSGKGPAAIYTRSPGGK